MALCSNCIHFDTEHEHDDPGAPCEARYGALGDSSFLEAEHPFDTCLCPGFQPEP